MKTHRFANLNQYLLFALLICITVLSLPTNALAVTGNEVVTIGLRHTLDITDPDYDSANETVPVRIYAFLDGGDPDNYSAKLQGELATYGGFEPATGLHYWFTDLSVGPNIAPAWNGFSWPSTYPFLSHYLDYNIRFIPVVAELFGDPGNGDPPVFLGVSTDTMIDGRSAGFRYNAGANVSESSLGAQLTPAGLEVLSDSHGKSTPAKINSLKDWLSQMANNTIPVSSVTAPRLCIPLEDAPTEFQDTDAFTSVGNKAEVQYIAWQGFKKACDAGTNASCLAAAAHCVRESDYRDPEHYKVCVDTLQATLIDHTFSDIEDLDIEFAGLGSPALESRVTLNGQTGLFDIALNDVTIQWNRKPGLCSISIPLPPKEPIDQAEIERLEPLAEWQECNNVDINIDRTCTHCGPIDYPNSGADGYVTRLDIDPQDAEKLLESDSGLGSLGLSGINYNMNVEACGENYWTKEAFNGDSLNIRDQIQPLLEGTLSVLHSDINQAWIGMNPDFEYTETIDELMRPFEAGTTELEPDTVSLDQQFEECLEDADAGLACNYNTRLTNSQGLPVAQWLDLPTGFSNNKPPFSLDGKIPSTNMDFDASVLISADLLNQHVEARFSEALTFSFLPTYQQLGLTPPANKYPHSVVPQLTGTTLGNLNSIFAQFGGADISINVRPTELKPFIWMNPDASFQDTTLTAQIAQLNFQVAVNNNPVLKGYLSLVDTDMTTDFNDDPEQLVEIALDEYSYTSIAYESKIPGCAIRPLSETTACDKGTMNQLASLVIPEVAKRFDQFFDGVVGPQVFKQGGDFAASVGLEKIATVNQYGTVGLYGVFQEGCSAEAYDLTPNTWHQISLPCLPAAAENTAAAILGDDIKGDYGINWIVFEAGLTGGYTLLGANSIMKSGFGYWILQLNDESAFLDMPDSALPNPAVQTNGCETIGGCLPILMNTAGATVGWSLSGNPFDRSIAIENLRVKTNDQANCAETEACDIDLANTEEIALNQAFRFENGSYSVLTSTDSLGPWHAAWWATYPNTAAAIPRLLMPVR